jgi:hypothetical protein
MGNFAMNEQIIKQVVGNFSFVSYSTFSNPKIQRAVRTNGFLLRAMIEKENDYFIEDVHGSPVENIGINVLLVLSD